jgi:hypothetical protein
MNDLVHCGASSGHAATRELPVGTTPQLDTSKCFSKEALSSERVVNYGSKQLAMGFPCLDVRCYSGHHDEAEVHHVPDGVNLDARDHYVKSCR